MRRYLATTAMFIAGLLAGIQGASAQSALLDLPRDSQHAMILQRIGVTDITINYHRPQVKGRKIFGPGTPQPYGKVWRAGANENTTIEFSNDVTVEGKPLPKGVYGLHMIPGETDWTVIFSKNSTSWGSFTYDQAEDALRVTVKARPADLQEALVYEIDDVHHNAATVTMRWEKLAIPFHVEADTQATVMASLHKQLRARPQFEWAAWSEASEYLMDNKLDLEEALKYADRSIQVEDRFENEMDKSRSLDLLGRKDEALAPRNKALAMGTQQQLHSFGRQLQIQGKNAEGLEVFRKNIAKDPNSFVSHNELARLAVAKGDFDGALKEMKLSADTAPASLKPATEALVKRLENKEDINK